MYSDVQVDELLNSLEEPKQSDKKKATKSTVGLRIEVAKYALKNGFEAAANKFNVNPATAYDWMNQFRKGHYDGIPLNAQAISHRLKTNATRDNGDELRARIKILEEQNTKLIAALERMAKK